MFYIFNVQGKYVGYSDSPVDEKDLELRGETVENVDAQSHVTLQEKIKQGYNLLVGLNLLPPKPSQYHKWDGENWSDTRTQEQITESKRKNMPTLTPIEFDIKLNNAGLYDAVQELIKDNFELRIAYNRATFFSRTAPFIDQARIALGLTDEQVDSMWLGGE